MDRIPDLIRSAAYPRLNRRESSDSLEPLIEKLPLSSDSHDTLVDEKASFTGGKLETKEATEGQGVISRTSWSKDPASDAVKIEKSPKNKSQSWASSFFLLGEKWARLRAWWNRSRRSTSTPLFPVIPTDEDLNEEDKSQDRVTLMAGENLCDCVCWHYAISRHENVYPSDATPKELLVAKTFIFTFITEVMRTTIADMKEARPELFTGWAKQLIEVLPDSFMLIHCEFLLPRLFMAIDALWHDHDIRSHCQKMAPLTTRDHIDYFFSQLSRISRKGYVPSHEDVRRICGLGVSLSERGNLTRFRYQKSTWSVVDFSRFRSTRKGQVYRLGRVVSIVFTVDMRHYNAASDVRPGSNRLRDALAMWESVVNSKWLEVSNFVLCFVKSASFATMVKTHPIDKCFEDCRLQDPANPVQATQYVADRFMSVNRDRDLANVMVHIVSDLPGSEDWRAVKQFLLRNPL